MVVHCIIRLSIYILSLAVTLSACNFGQEGSTHHDQDSCKTAVPFANAGMYDAMAKQNFSGHLDNYWGDDTTRLDFRHTFKNGELVQSTFYYYSGQVQEEYSFKCGSLHGDAKTYYENGQLARMIPHRYGRKHGTGLLYDSLGTLIEKVIFENDSVIGKAPSPDRPG